MGPADGPLGGQQKTIAYPHSPPTNKRYLPRNRNCTIYTSILIPSLFPATKTLCPLLPIPLALKKFLLKSENKE
jgi:hypothetical protein